MANENPTSNKPHDDALAALHGLGDESSPSNPPPGHPADPEQVYEVEEVAEAADETEPSPSASGFVGMLSKNTPPSDDPGFSRPTMPTPQPARPTPQPSAGPQDAPATTRTEGTYEVRMAREVALPPSSTLSSARPGARAAPRRKVPGWYHAAVPVMFTVSSLLLLIGFWALGAAIYVLSSSPQAPEDIHYPLISWDSNIGEYGGISSGSKLMAFIMLVALPVAISLIVMAVIMQRQVSKAAQAAAKK